MLQIQQLKKAYHTERGRVEAVVDVAFEVGTGEVKS